MSRSYTVIDCPLLRKSRQSAVHPVSPINKQDGQKIDIYENEQGALKDHFASEMHDHRSRNISENRH